MILIIDNYDSFTYNLVQMVESLYGQAKVIKNDELTIEEIEMLKPNGIIISPGPSTPDNAGICLEVVKSFYESVPILGICLGHQVIAQTFGATIMRAEHLMHGKIDRIKHDSKGIYTNMPQRFIATRYHSLVVSEHHIPESIMITSRSTVDNYIMGIRHVEYPVEGLQFHPESYKTENGHLLISNFLMHTRLGGN